MAVIRKRLGLLLIVVIIFYSEYSRVEAAAVRSQRESGVATSTASPQEKATDLKVKEMFDDAESPKKPLNAKVPETPPPPPPQGEKNLEKETKSEKAEPAHGLDNQDKSSDAKSVITTIAPAADKPPAEKGAEVASDAPKKEVAAIATTTSAAKPGLVLNTADETHIDAREKLAGKLSTAAPAVKEKLTTAAQGEDKSKSKTSDQKPNPSGEDKKPETKTASDAASMPVSSTAAPPLEQPEEGDDIKAVDEKGSDYDSDPGDQPEGNEEKKEPKDSKETPKEEKEKPKGEPPKIAEVKPTEKPPVPDNDASKLPKKELSKLPADTSDDFSQSENSHFMVYMIVCGVLVVVAYLVVHNKKKIIGLIVEGRANGSSGRRGSRGGGARYRRLDKQLNDEDAEPLKGSDRHNVIY